MEFQFFGVNCLRITTKKTNIVVDDNLAELGLKPVIKDGDVVLYTGSAQPSTSKDIKLLVVQPGDYEVSDVQIQGIPARAYKGESNTLTNTIFKIEYEDTSAVVFGNSYPELTDSQLEMLGEVQVLFIPVGDKDVTLSGSDALKVIKKIEPNIVIPTLYSDQETLSEAIKELSMEPKETVTKYKVKPNTFEEDQATSLVIIERS